MVAQITGITDIHTLLSIFGLSMSTTFFSSIFEKINWKKFGTDRSKVWQPFLCGLVPFAFLWAIIYCYFFQYLSRDNAPAFVWALVFVLAAVEILSLVVLWMQWAEAWIFRENYVMGELCFMFLSLVGKQLLAWIYHGGHEKGQL